ncbi:helix-turn-helix domain-containing protein [Halorientalis sp.]|uniref:helix-turn-helix domain-containing protein n=1 Tax=Halorientalis sp. TaxID=1931229 RepID=UPI00262BAE5A|nr:helix-turn-helix domain-containing protein [Halorientalis sp.]
MTVEQANAGRILVVEDDHGLAGLYAEWLDDTYDVETTHDGTEALERLDETVDVVLLDRMMPGLSGSDVLATIRESDLDPRVVMVSAVTPDFDVVRMGFDGYLEKPVDAAALRETVDRMLTRAEYDEKLQELFSLIERQDTLEAVKEPDALRNSEEYRTLTERLDAVQADVESLLSALPDEDFRVAVERLQRATAEWTSDRRYESLTEDVLDSSKEATVVVDADGEVVWANDATETLLGLDRTTARGQAYTAVVADQLQDITADDESLASVIRTGLASHGRELEATVHAPGSDGETERWLEYWSGPIETGLYAGGRIEHYHEVTGRHRREQYLRTLHSATRELMTAETVEAVAEQTVATATTGLELPYAALFTREDGTGDLVPTARRTTNPDTDPDLPTLSGGDGPVWTTFANRSGRVAATAHRGRTDATTWLDDHLADWVLCPLGKHGVFLVGTPAGVELSSTQRDLAETWAANTRQALEELAKARGIRSRDRELKQQNERLRRLDRINRLIRSIVSAVVDADTRVEVEEKVCRQLLRIDTITGAWIADIDLPSNDTVRRASAGDLDQYLSAVPPASSDANRTDVPDTTPPVPARAARETQSAVSVGDLVGIEDDVWWRSRGLKRGSNSIVAVPIVHESVCFGGLEIHTDRPQGIGEDELDALEELGLIIGHAIGAIRQRDALLAGGTTHLTFRVESDPTLSAFTTTADVPLVAVDVSRRADRTWAVFTTLDVGDTTDVESLERRLETTTEASVLRADTAKITCVVPLAEASPIRRLTERGVALQEIEPGSGSGDLRVTVQLPPETDVRGYVERVTEELDGAELVGKYDQPIDNELQPTPSTALNERLTDRQRETLQMAFHAGYFDWPRGNDAVTVAAELDIAQSTFSQHLRTAERKVLEHVFF